MKLQLASIFLAVTAACLLQTHAKKIPSFIPVCKRTSVDFDACIVRATEMLRSRLARGIPELRVPPLEPLSVPMVHLEQGTNAVKYNCTLTNVQVYGLSDYIILEEEADVVNKLLIKGKLQLPTLRLESDYTINGRILLVPLQGRGKFYANLTNAIGDLALFGHLVERKGVKYYENKEVDVSIGIRDASVNFENLFNGDKTLGPATNKFLNENARDIIEEIKPAVEEVVGHLVLDVSNKVFNSFPYDQLFPE